MVILGEESVENVLILQGGGSLGAYECGVFKTLAKYRIQFDIIAGTSIGAINAAIITAHKKGKEPAKELENFWLELSEKTLQFSPPYLTIYPNDEMRAIITSLYSATFGNRKVFTRTPMLNPYNYFSFKLPYPLFDITPLRETLEKYIDLSTLHLNGQGIKANNPDNKSIQYDEERPRLIVTSTNIQTSMPVIFDSNRMNFNSNHIIASAGFPFYGIGWTKVDEKYLWDGALLSNTPLREVIDASPSLDKMVYLVSIFPHYQKQLPNDMFETWHRARDIVYTDKTDSDIQNSKAYSNSLSLLKDMHDLLLKYNNSLTKATNDSSDLNFLADELKEIDKKYSVIKSQRGAVIRKIVRIERPETTPFLFEDADFSELTIKKLIKQGESDTLKALFP